MRSASLGSRQGDSTIIESLTLRLYSTVPGLTAPAPGYTPTGLFGLETYLRNCTVAHLCVFCYTRMPCQTERAGPPPRPALDATVAPSRERHAALCRAFDGGRSLQQGEEESAWCVKTRAVYASHTQASLTLATCTDG